MKNFSKLFVFLICLSAACGVFAAQSFSEVKNGAVSEKVGAAVSGAKASASSAQQSSNSVSLIKDITDADFSKEVLNYKGVVLVDFWSSGCAPCKKIEPVIEKVAQDYKGKVKFVKMREDVSKKTVAAYGITSYPFIGFFKNGVAEGYVEGFNASSSEADIRRAIQSLL